MSNEAQRLVTAEEWDHVDRRSSRAESVGADEFHRWRRRVDDRLTNVETHAVQWNLDSANMRDKYSGWRREHERSIKDWVEGLEEKVEKWLTAQKISNDEREKREHVYAVLIACNIVLLAWNIIQNIMR